MKKTWYAVILTLVLAVSVPGTAVFAEELSDLPAAEAVTGDDAVAAVLGTDGEETKETEPEKEEPEKPVYKTGIYMVDGTPRYFRNGQFTKVTGVAKLVSNGKWLYVEKGIFKKATGAAKRITDGKTVYVKNGVFKKATGAAKRISDKKTVYLKNGVFNKKTGVSKSISGNKWVYVKNGIFQKMTGLAKKISNKKWTFVRNGVMVTNPKQIVLTAADQKAGRQEILAMVYAKTIFDKATSKKMSKIKKMDACFNYVASPKNTEYVFNRIPHYTGMDWPVVYTMDVVKQGGSNCFGFSSVYGYLAKLCGCKNVYFCTSGYHSWVDIDGLVYDPVLLYHAQWKKVFAWTYDQAIAMAPGNDFRNESWQSNPWMRIKAPEVTPVVGK